MKIRALFSLLVFLLSVNVFSQVQLEYELLDDTQYFGWKQSMEEFAITNSAGKVLAHSKFGGRYKSSEGLTVVYITYEECEWGDEFTNYGFIDNKDIIVIPLKYSFAESFIKGRALVKLDEKYSLIDKTGREVFSLNADAAFSLGANYIVTKLNNQYSLIDRNGKLVKNFKYDNIYSPRDDLAHVEYQNKHGFIDAAGAERIPLIYSYAENFSEGLALVAENTYAWGFIDTKGKIIIPLKYEKADSFSEGLAAVQVIEGLWGFIDGTGRIVIPIKYHDVGNFRNGEAYVTTGDEDFMINKKGERIN